MTMITIEGWQDVSERVAELHQLLLSDASSDADRSAACSQVAAIAAGTKAYLSALDCLVLSAYENDLQVKQRLVDQYAAVVRKHETEALAFAQRLDDLVIPASLEQLLLWRTSLEESVVCVRELKIILGDIEPYFTQLRKVILFERPWHVPLPELAQSCNSSLSSIRHILGAFETRGLSDDAELVFSNGSIAVR